MKIAATIGALALVAQLAGCPQSPINPTDVITIAQAVCAFVPTAETIANIIAAGKGSVTTATQVADAICSAVPKATATEHATATGDVQVGTVTVNGQTVKVVGHYTVHH